MKNCKRYLLMISTSMLLFACSDKLSVWKDNQQNTKQPAVQQCADSHFTGPNCNQCSERFTGPNCDHCNPEKGYGSECKAYGSVTDQDGNSYKTVIIGSQEWMAENLRVVPGSNQVLGADYFYPNGKSDNVAAYGYLYTWDTAQNICPSGWHLPSREEFSDLLTYVGNNRDSISSNLLINLLILIDAHILGWKDYRDFLALIAKSTVWGYGLARDDFGFGGLPAGMYLSDYSNHFYGGFGYHGSGNFWSSTENDSSLAYSLFLNGLMGEVGIGGPTEKLCGLSVRCLKDTSSDKVVTSANETGKGVGNADSTYIKPSFGSVTFGNDTYKTIKIGSQIWLAENLRTVPENKKLNSDYYYPNGEESNVATYGYLYKWDTAQNICPSGWHLPTREEFSALRAYVDNNRTSSSKFLALIAKSTTWKYYSNYGGDDFGFGGLPAGLHNYDKYYSGLGDFGYFWSSTAEDDHDSRPSAYAYGQRLGNGNADVRSYSKSRGLSVRCIKDSN